jgi:hypothetical protein
MSFVGTVLTCFIIDGTPISVGLTPLSARPRHPTISNTPAEVCCLPPAMHAGTPMMVFLQKENYRTRVHTRDPYCLISGLEVFEDNYTRFKATHIFPRAHEVDVRPSCLFCFHLTNIIYPVGPQRLSNSYHRSRTSCGTWGSNED